MKQSKRIDELRTSIKKHLDIIQDNSLKDNNTIHITTTSFSTKDMKGIPILKTKNIS